MGADLRAGLRYVASVRVLVILTAVQMVVNLCLAAEKLIVFYARDTLGLTPSLAAEKDGHMILSTMNGLPGYEITEVGGEVWTAVRIRGADGHS